MRPHNSLESLIHWPVRPSADKNLSCSPPYDEINKMARNEHAERHKLGQNQSTPNIKTPMPDGNHIVVTLWELLVTVNENCPKMTENGWKVGNRDRNIRKRLRQLERTANLDDPKSHRPQNSRAPNSINPENSILKKQGPKGKQAKNVMVVLFLLSNGSIYWYIRMTEDQNKNQ